MEFNPKPFAHLSLVLALAIQVGPLAAGPEGENRSYDGPIIDMHIHAFTEASHGRFFGLQHPPTLRNETYQGVATAEEQKLQTLAQFEKHNIVLSMVDSGELWKDESPDKILIGGGLKPIDTLRAQHEAGQLDVIAELAPFYKGKLADDPEILPYFALAEELGVPIGFHILPGGPNGGRRAVNADPMQLEKALVSHPGARVYVMHGGWPYVEDMKALMYAHPQVYVDVAVINWILPEREFHAYLESLVTAGFGDRIMYGSDQMVWPQTIGIGIEAVNSAPGLSLQQKADIFYNNAARFLGLSEEEIRSHKKSR